MSAEAIARLREARPVFQSTDDAVVKAADLRALLDEYDAAMQAGRTVVKAADEMREQWAEIEERLTNERDTAHARGVAEERARVVAWLRARSVTLYDDLTLRPIADRIERGEHEEGT